MSEALALPTRREEAWRYSDLDALESVWPLPETEKIDVQAGAGLDKVIILEGGPSESVVRQMEINVGWDSVANIHILNLGGSYSRFELTVTMDEETEFNLGAAQIGGDNKSLEIVTHMKHAAANAKSRQVVRSVLGGHASGTFLGKIEVVRHAQKTDAAQSVKAMLLDRTATANAKPELEIFADDVKCEHGATVGELDKAALFYMASRGIPPKEARRLMLQAFVADAFVSVADDAAREDIENKALAALEAIT